MPHESTVNPHEFNNEQQYGNSMKSSRASNTTGNMEEKASSTVPSLLAASAIAEADLSLDAQILNDNKVLAFNVRTPVTQSQNPSLSSRPQTPNVLNHDFDDDSDEDDADL